MQYHGTALARHFKTANITAEKKSLFSGGLRPHAAEVAYARRPQVAITEKQYITSE